MSITSIAILKSWFETGKPPSQEEFESLIDSFHHKSGDIEIPAGKKIKIGNDQILSSRLIGIVNLDSSRFCEHIDSADYNSDKSDIINCLITLAERFNSLNTFMKNHGLTS